MDEVVRNIDSESPMWTTYQEYGPRSSSMSRRLHLPSQLELIQQASGHFMGPLSRGDPRISVRGFGGGFHGIDLDQMDYHVCDTWRCGNGRHVIRTRRSCRSS